MINEILLKFCKVSYVHALYMAHKAPLEPDCIYIIINLRQLNEEYTSFFLILPQASAQDPYRCSKQWL